MLLLYIVKSRVGGEPPPSSAAPPTKSREGPPRELRLDPRRSNLRDAPHPTPSGLDTVSRELDDFEPDSSIGARAGHPCLPPRLPHEESDRVRASTSAAESAVVRGTTRPQRAERPWASTRNRTSSLFLAESTRPDRGTKACALDARHEFVCGGCPLGSTCSGTSLSTPSPSGFRGRAATRGGVTVGTTGIARTGKEVTRTNLIGGYRVWAQPTTAQECPAIVVARWASRARYAGIRV